MRHLPRCRGTGFPRRHRHRVRQVIKTARSSESGARDVGRRVQDDHLLHWSAPTAMPTAARRGPCLPPPTIRLHRRGHPATPHGRCPRYDCQPQRFCPVWLTLAAPVGFAGEPVHQLPPRRHPPPRASGRPRGSDSSAIIGSAPAIRLATPPNGSRFTCAAKHSGAASGASACWAALTVYLISGAL